LHRFTIRYHGVPANGLRTGVNKSGQRCFFSCNWPDKAREWLPMIDHASAKATSEFLITAPTKCAVVANGLLQEEVWLGDGLKMTHWKQSVIAIRCGTSYTSHGSSYRSVRSIDDEDVGSPQWSPPVQQQEIVEAN
jgi:hypothetical protein